MTISSIQARIAARVGALVAQDQRLAAAIAELEHAQADDHANLELITTRMQAREAALAALKHVRGNDDATTSRTT